MRDEVKKIYDILAEILGESKTGYFDGEYQYEFPCPCCVEKYGSQEIAKMNLSVSISKQKFQCWKCSSEGGNMHGSILKLIRRYGNEDLFRQYMDAIRSIRESRLYKLGFNDDEFVIDDTDGVIGDVRLPDTFQEIRRDRPNSKSALRYLFDRGVTWDIIERFGIGYTLKEESEENRKYSYRVVIPSYNALGELNYWVGRDYLPERKGMPQRAKYANPQAKKSDIIFNEGKIQWDADITLVEGPFDHIVTPNSVPLLGKCLTTDYKLYWDIMSKANANVNIWLDNDIADNGKEIYGLLNHGRLYGKVRYVLSDFGKDPSEIFERYGNMGIIRSLQTAHQLKESETFIVPPSSIPLC